MAIKKNSFILYNEYYKNFLELSAEERGALIMAIFEYNIYGNIKRNLSPMCRMAFSFIQSQLDRDNQKYQKMCERNQENGKKGGRPTKNPKNPNGL